MTTTAVLEIREAEPEGPQRGPSLLFVHGGYHAAWCWEDNFFPYFSGRGYRVRALSLRGHGGSDGFERLDKLGLEHFTEDVLTVLDSLPDKPVLVGHSMGGAIVQRVLAERPDSARAAVLMSSPPPSGIGFTASFRWMRTGWTPMWRLYKLHQGKLAVNGRIPPEAFPFPCFFAGALPPEQQASYLDRVQKESHRAGKQTGRRFLRRPVPPRVPLLVMGGDEDWFFSTDVFHQTAAIYGTKAVIIPGSGHMVMLDAAWRGAAREIEGFLTGL